MEMEAKQRDALHEFLSGLIQWVSQRDKLTTDLEREVLQTLQDGNKDRLLTLVQQYEEGASEEAQLFLGILKNSLGKTEWTVADALRCFPSIYGLLYEFPELALGHPLFGRILNSLRDNRSDTIFGPTCSRFLQAACERIAAPPFFSRVLSELDKTKRYPSGMKVFLQYYEDLHQRVKEIWGRETDYKKRKAALLQELPIAGETLETIDERGDLLPQYVALAILAQGTSNISDLQHLRARARKARRALKSLGFDYAPPREFAGWEKIAALLAKAQETISEE